MENIYLWSFSLLGKKHLLTPQWFTPEVQLIDLWRLLCYLPGACTLWVTLPSRSHGSYCQLLTSKSSMDVQKGCVGSELLLSSLFPCRPHGKARPRPSSHLVVNHFVHVISNNAWNSGKVICINQKASRGTVLGLLIISSYMCCHALYSAWKCWDLWF